MELDLTTEESILALISTAYSDARLPIGAYSDNEDWEHILGETAGVSQLASITLLVNEPVWDPKKYMDVIDECLYELDEAEAERRRQELLEGDELNDEEASTFEEFVFDDLAFFKLRAYRLYELDASSFRKPDSRKIYFFQEMRGHHYDTEQFLGPFLSLEEIDTYFPDLEEPARIKEEKSVREGQAFLERLKAKWKSQVEIR